jgi:hypothetical protein
MECSICNKICEPSYYKTHRSTHKRCKSCQSTGKFVQYPDPSGKKNQFCQDCALECYLCVFDLEQGIQNVSLYKHGYPNKGKWIYNEKLICWAHKSMNKG